MLDVIRVWTIPVVNRRSELVRCNITVAKPTYRSHVFLDEFSRNAQYDGQKKSTSFE